MTTYLDQLKSTLKTGFETSMATDAKGFNNEAAETFLTQLQNIDTLEILKSALAKLNTDLVDGYLYTHPLKAIIAGSLAKITPEAIEVEKGSLETIASLTKQLTIAKAALKTQSELHDKKVETLSKTVRRLTFSQPHTPSASRHQKAEAKHKELLKPTIFQP